LQPDPPVRNRNTSIWQSAKHDNVRDWTTKPGQQAGSSPARGPAAAPAAAPTTVAQKVKGFFARYGSLDWLGWVQCEWEYLRYMAESRFPQYNDWKSQKPPSLDYGVIAFRLPSTCKILMIGDWGTRMTDNVALLRQALKELKPDAIIHLGDVYYSGTPQECKENVLDVLGTVVKELGIERPPFFSLPGNHDYYSGGRGFYQMIGQVNASLPGCEQKASYFCLRTADERWQFLGMDTGYNDRDPINHKSPALVDNEADWHRDKLDKFNGTTVLLSHHQLFSANEVLNDGPRPYLNEALNKVFQPYFDRVAAWFWGHEHCLIFYKDDLSFPGDAKVLKKGRLVGCSAYEESLTDNPYHVDPRCTAVAFMNGMKMLDRSPYKSSTQDFYNHAFALLEVSPQQIKASYYQYPSWDQDFAPVHAPLTPPLYFEDLPFITRP
jgi:hypothetical protein